MRAKGQEVHPGGQGPGSPTRYIPNRRQGICVTIEAR